MKNFLLLLVLVSFASCQKDELPHCEGLNCDLIGEWNWTRTYGSIAGYTWTPENTGETKTLKVTLTDLSFFVNDSLVDQSAYQVFETDTMFGDDIVRTFITYDNSTRLYILEDQKLELRDLCFDCFDDHYEKN